MTMIQPSGKKVRVAELKAHLSGYLRQVRSGETIIVYDRETPIARLIGIPAAASDALLVIRPALRPFREWTPGPPLPGITAALLEAELLQDRETGR